MDTFDWISAGRATTSSKDVSQILEFAKKHMDTLKNISEGEMTKKRLAAFRKLFDACFTEIEIPLAKSTKTMKVAMADIGKMVTCLANHCTAWKAIASNLKTLESLRTVLYHDEFTGGNVVSQDASRKFLIVYLHILDVQANCFDADMWLPITLIRKRQLKNVAGGTSGFLYHILKALYAKPIQFWTNAAIVSKQLVLTNLLGDEAALKETYNTKGLFFSFLNVLNSSGKDILKPRRCFWCQNLRSMRGYVGHRSTYSRMCFCGLYGSRKMDDDF